MPCAPDAPFATTVPLSVSPRGANDFSPALTADEAQLFFVRQAPDASAVVMTASRLADGGFGDPSPVTIGGLAPARTSPIDLAVSPGGERLYLSYVAGAGAVDYELSVASRTADGSYLTPERIAALSAPTDERTPFESGEQVYYAGNASLDGGSPTFQLYRVPAAGGLPTRLVELTAPPDHHASPVLSHDQLWLYFSTTRDAIVRPSGAKDLDIWVARRAQPNGRFEAPARVSSLSTPDVERPGWLSVDHCRMYLSRDDADFLSRLWVATRVHP